MIDPFEEEIAKALAGLREEYKLVLPKKLEELRAAIEAFRAADREGVTAAARAAAWDVARRQAHALRGTAGSYGFAEVSVAAGAIEDSLDKTGNGAAAWPVLDEALSKLKPEG